MLRRYRFLYLLLSIFLLFILYPFLELFGAASKLGPLLFSLIVICALYAVGRTRKRICIGFSLAFPFLFLRALIVLEAIPAKGIPLCGILATFFLSAFTAYALVLVLMHTVKAEEVTLNTIFAAQCVYLLIGFLWTSFYALIEIGQPGSFVTSQGKNLNVAASYFELVYYSFVTLTSLGYGDISPVSTFAKSFSVLEPVIGIFYVAVLVSRFVSIYTHSTVRVEGSGEGR